MRIKKISVYGLFDLFAHEIELKEGGITIIHGPNGFGKTWLLEMIKHFFLGNISFYTAVPFSRFVISFEDGRVVTVQRVVAEEGQVTFVVALSGTASGRFECDDHNNGPFTAWLKKQQISLKADVVATRRLESVIYREGKPQDILTVQKHSQGLAQKIQEALRNYAASSEELDRTFPMRLLQYKLEDSVKAAALTQKLEELEEKRVRLTQLGFLDPEKANGAIEPKDIEKKLDVFSVYVEDTEKKLQVFDEMADKISLLMEIINKRFLYKKMSVHRERGFEFTTKNGKPLELAKLSSGEQQELVLLYGMLFQVPAGSLLLIDEPEISLHVAWQMNFLSDLERIVKLAGFDLILATHSPQIINDRWDLTVELKGPPV